MLFAGAGQSVKLGCHRDAGGTPAVEDEQAALDDARRKDLLEAVAAECGGRALALVADVTERAEVRYASVGVDPE